MARPENAQIEEPAEKVIPITDPEAETAGSPGSVTKRPFVLDKKRGSGGGKIFPPGSEGATQMQEMPNTELLG